MFSPDYSSSILQFYLPIQQGRIQIKTFFFDCHEGWKEICPCCSFLACNNIHILKNTKTGHFGRFGHPYNFVMDDQTTTNMDPCYDIHVVNKTCIMSTAHSWNPTSLDKQVYNAQNCFEMIVLQKWVKEWSNREGTFIYSSSCEF